MQIIFATFRKFARDFAKFRISSLSFQTRVRNFTTRTTVMIAKNWDTERLFEFRVLGNLILNNRGEKGEKIIGQILLTLFSG